MNSTFKDKNLGQIEKDLFALRDLVLRQATSVYFSSEVNCLVANIRGSCILLDEKSVPSVPPFVALPAGSYRDNALSLALAEMDRQDRKWGPQRKQHPFKWVAILTEECGEVAQAALDQERSATTAIVHAEDEFLKEAVQVAAVAIQMVAARLQSHDDAKKLRGLAK